MTGLSRNGSQQFLVTCEHGGYKVPAKYADLFSSPGSLAALQSHRGYDPGAIDAAKQISKSLNAQLIASRTSRLLVDLNRSVGNPELFSKYTSVLSGDQTAKLLDEHYHPYRRRVVTALAKRLVVRSPLIHLSVHTFAPRVRGQWRPLDVGFLFDPRRRNEARFCKAWRGTMAQAHSRIRVVENQPYAGTDDGFTTALRRQFADKQYVGIEIEISHRYSKRSVAAQSKVVQALLGVMPSKEVFD